MVMGTNLIRAVPQIKHSVNVPKLQSFGNSLRTWFYRKMQCFGVTVFHNGLFIINLNILVA